MPATIGMCLTGTPLIVGLIYYGLSGFGGTMSHSGYWMAEHHDEHHRLFNCNFGVGGSFWDRLMHTEAPVLKDRKPPKAPVAPVLREPLKKKVWWAQLLANFIPFDAVTE